MAVPLRGGWGGKGLAIKKKELFLVSFSLFVVIVQAALNVEEGCLGRP